LVWVANSFLVNDSQNRVGDRGKQYRQGKSVRKWGEADEMRGEVAAF